jgi:hypothetical protein
VLVQGQGLPSDDATWEPLQDFKDLYPDVQLEDELFEEAESDVMTECDLPAPDSHNWLGVAST